MSGRGQQFFIILKTFPLLQRAGGMLKDVCLPLVNPDLLKRLVDQDRTVETIGTRVFEDRLPIFADNVRRLAAHRAGRRTVRSLPPLLSACRVGSPEVLSSDDPVTLWIDELRHADEAAARKLWNHFFTRLYELGRKKLRPETRRVYDEEDAAQSAFQSVCAGIAAGRFPDLGGRGNLWHLLVVITATEGGASTAARSPAAPGRAPESGRFHLLASQRGFARMPRMNVLVSREPTPEFAAEFVETCESLFQSLDDPALQQVVALRMEGYEDAEIADRLKCSRRTVQRRLEVIRRHWDRLELSSE